MPEVRRITYSGELPDAFFTLVSDFYRHQGIDAQEDPAAIRRLFELEAQRNAIIFYTDFSQIRLVGIFPRGAEEVLFGFWETLENIDLNRQAFGLLEEDARAQGRGKIVGPLNFNTFHRYRLRLGKVPSWRVFDREPINQVYYPSLLEQLGYQIGSSFESRKISQADIPAIYQQKQPLLDQIKALPYHFIPLTPAVWQQHEVDIYTLVQEIFGANPAYKPVSFEQFRLQYNIDFARKLCPYSSVMFRHKESGLLSALSFCHPNYQSLQLPSDVKPTFEEHYPMLDKKVLLVKTVGVHPSARKQGLMSFLGAYAMLSFQGLYQEVIFCLMRSDNYSTHFTNQLPSEVAKYALYEKRL